MKCVVCDLSLEEGSQYVGHMVIQHDYPISWVKRQSCFQELQKNALRDKKANHKN